MKQGLSGSFFWNRCISFFLKLEMVLGSGAYLGLWARTAHFWGKSKTFVQKRSNTAPKRIFDFLVKWADLWSLVFCKNCLPWKNLLLKLLPKMYLANEMPLSWIDWHETWFFDYRWTWMKGKKALFWAWKCFPLLTLYAHSETGQKVHKNCSDGFYEKVLIHGKWAILGWKMNYFLITLNWL